MFFRKKYIVGYIILTLAAFYVITTEFILRPITEKALIELPKEYSRLAIMPNSILDISETLNRSTSVSYRYVFDTNKSRDEIKKYYLEESRKKQWIIVKKSKEGLTCTKGDYQLGVVYKNSNVTGEYDIVLRWPITN